MEANEVSSNSQEGIESSGNRFNLSSLLDPEVPGPSPGPQHVDSDGWAVIDSLGAWDCGLCEFRIIEDIPHLYKEKWSRAFSSILRRTQTAETKEDICRGLKWFLIAPQVFLREPRRGGRKGQGNREVASRFNCFVKGDWGNLLSMLDIDKMLQNQRINARNVGRTQEDPVV